MPRPPAKSKRSSAAAPAATGPQAIWVFYGDDEMRVSAAAAAQVNTLCPESEQSFGLEVISAQVEEEDEAVLAAGRGRQALQTVGFLGNKTVWLRGATFLGEEKPGKSQAVRSAVAELAALLRAGLPPGVSLVISAPKISKRSAFYKALETIAEIKELSVPSGYSAAQRYRGDEVRAALERHGVRAEPAAVTLFIERASGTSRQIDAEAQKLAVYQGPDAARPLTRTELDRLVAPNREAVIWELGDQIAQGQIAAALQTLERLYTQREDPVRLVINLEYFFRDLLTMAACIERRWVSSDYGNALRWTDDPAARALLADTGFRLGTDFRAFKAYEKAKALDPRKLSQMFCAVVAAHEAMVSGAATPRLQVELLISQLAAIRNRRAA